MIPVRRVPEPAGFDADVRQKGRLWLRKHPTVTRPTSYWTPYLPPLEDGFRGLCGYAAMFDPTGGTVDHYLCFRNFPDLAYEWSNYRFASATLNACKQDADDTVLDPFEVGSDWFEVLLPSLQMCVTDAIPRKLKTKAEYTLDRLKLRDGERVLRWRRAWYVMYLEGKLTLEGLEAVAPLIAAAVRTNGIAPQERIPSPVTCARPSSRRWG